VGSKVTPGFAFSSYSFSISRLPFSVFNFPSSHFLLPKSYSKKIKKVIDEKIIDRKK